MTLQIIAALATALILAGIILAIQGSRKLPEPPPRPKTNRTRPAPWENLTQRTRTLLAAGLTIGALTALTTGWTIAIIVIPALLLGIPYLFSDNGADKKINRIEAIEEWVRALAGSLGAGSSLEQSIRATLRSAPDPIRPELTTLVARINSRMPLATALRLFADDLDDIIGDTVCAALILGADRRGAALAGILNDLASSLADEVRARRLIEADRAKPRTTARWVTIIMLLLLGGLFITGDYVTPYRTPLGQLILITILAVFALILVWMKRMSTTKKLPRFIGSNLKGSNP